MFRRRWSGLPADPVFSADLKELGYFINDIDEIRSLDDSDYYFKYFLTKNTRWNERQRFVFNEAVRNIILTRLTDLNGQHKFTTLPLPLGTRPTQPHVPILTSPNLRTASRVVLFVGEPCQALGVLAHRVIGGRGGITHGSVLGLVSALAEQRSSSSDPSPPGVILANTGELWWWPEGRRGLTPIERHGVPMVSAVHWGRWHEKANEIEGNASVADHVKRVFEEVVMNGEMVNKKAKLDVIAVGGAADEVEAYLNDDEVWASVGSRLNCLVVVGGFYSAGQFQCDGFERFMEERGRAYVLHHTPVDMAVAGPRGNPGTTSITSFGCPVYSAGPAKVTETMLIEAQPAILEWIQHVALKGDAYKNEVIEVFGEADTGVTTEQPDSSWGAPETDVAAEEPEAEKTEAKVSSNAGTADGSVLQAQDGPADTHGKGAKVDVKRVDVDTGGGSAKAKKDGNKGAQPGGAQSDDVPEAQDLVEATERVTIGN